MAAKRTNFHVRILHASATKLAGGSNKVSPYITINFDFFKSFKTAPIKKTSEPNWSGEFPLEFEYHTTAASSFSAKKCVIECYDKSFLGADTYLGGVEIDLQTIACGSVSHELTMRDGRSPSGTFKFEMEMHEIANVEIDFFNLSLKNVTPNHEDLSLSIFVPKNAKLRAHCPPRNGNFTWEATDILSLQTSLKDLVIENAVFELHTEKPTRRIIGTTIIHLESFINWDCAKLPFSGEFTDSGLRVEGEMIMKNVPTFCQLSGGVNRDEGITRARIMFSHCPLPSVPLVGCTMDPLYCGFRGSKPTPPGVSPKSSDSDLPLPPGWTKEYDPVQQRYYYYFRQTKKSSWVHPAKLHQAPTDMPTEASAAAAAYPTSPNPPSFEELPAGWEAKLDPRNGQVYFINHSTKETTYDHPLSAQYKAKHATAEAPLAAADPPLPAGWEKKIEPTSGRPYYLNHNDKTTHWSLPQPGGYGTGGASVPPGYGTGGAPVPPGYGTGFAAPTYPAPQPPLGYAAAPQGAYGATQGVYGATQGAPAYPPGAYGAAGYGTAGYGAPFQPPGYGTGYTAAATPFGDSGGSAYPAPNQYPPY